MGTSIVPTGGGSLTIKPFPFKDRDVINVTIVGGCLEMFSGKLAKEVFDAQKDLLDFLNQRDIEYLLM